MKKIFIFLIVSLLTIQNSFAEFNTIAKQAFLIDVDSNYVIYKKNEDQKISPASLTKIMTSVIAFDLIKKKELSLTDKFTISKNAWRHSTKGYSSMFIMPNDKVTVEDLLHGIIIASGNDACVALAEGIAGTEEAFATLMNQKAKELNLKNTNFTNSSGIYDGNNYSTVEDVAKLSIYMIKEFPELYKMYAIKEFTWERTGGKPIKQGNRNVLLYKDIGVDGIKTGHLADSGFSLAASSKKYDRRVISVISGTASMAERGRESIRLLSYANSSFDLIKISKNTDAISIKAFNLSDKKINLRPNKDFYLTIPARQSNKIILEAEVTDLIKRSIKSGEKLGILKITYDGKLIGEIDLVSEKNIERVNFFTRFLNSISYFVWG